jgi:hypothetical protein
MAEIVSSVGVNFPDENIDPKRKTEKPFLLQYCRAAYSAYGDTPFGSIGWRSRDKYEWVKTYARGSQTIDRYKKVLTPDQDPTNNTLVVDWSVLPIIPKFRRIALGLLEKQNWDVQIDPIDPLAQTELEQQITLMKMKATMREAQKEVMGDRVSMPNDIMPGEGEPEDIDGIKIYEIGLRHKTAMEAEQAIELTFSQNDYESQRRQTLQDLFDYGVSAYKDYRDGDLVGFRRVDPRRLILSYCTYPDFRDLRYAGEILEVPVAQVIQMSNGELTKDDIDMIYKYASTNQWRPSTPVGNAYYGSYSDFWNRGKVQVLDLEIISADELVREERVDRRGNTIFGRASYDDYNNKKDKYKRKQVQGVYRAKWIVGTDIIFDYGKQYDIKRDPINMARAKSSYHINACDFFDMKTFSRMEAIIPYADAIQLAYYRLQHELNTSVPKGFNINLAALEEVSLSGGGQTMKPSDIIDLYLQRGVLVSRSTTFDGRPNPPAITELQGGTGGAIAEYWNLINQNLDMIRQTLGLNELTDGSTPNPKLLTTVAQLAASGTNNALSDIIYSDKQITQSLSEAIIIRVQDIVRTTDGVALADSLGKGTVELLKVSPDITRYTFGISIVDKPTAEEKTKLDELIKVALQQGQLDISDVIRLNNIPNIKQAELFLAYKVRKNMERKQQEALQMQQQNGQIQQQSALAAEQAKQQTAQMQAQIDIQLVQAKAEMEAKLIELRGQFDLERERIAATGRVESSFVQAKERDAANIRDNKTKLLQDDKMENMGEIDVPAELESRVAPETAGGQPLNLQQANVNFAEGPTEEEQALMQQQAMQQQGSQMGPEMQEQMAGQQEMPMEEMGQEQQMEESPNDMKRRMIEQYLQQAQ